MKLHDVEIKMSGHGRGEVFLDGIKVQGVRAVSFNSAVNCANEVTLTLNGNAVSVTGVADVSHIGSTAREFASPFDCRADAAAELARTCAMYSCPGVRPAPRYSWKARHSPPRYSPAYGLLVSEAEQFARFLGLDCVAAWLSAWQPEHTRWQLEPMRRKPDAPAYEWKLPGNDSGNGPGVTSATTRRR